MPNLNDFINLGGWYYNPKKIDKVLSLLSSPLFGPAAYGIKDSGKSKYSLLFKNVEKIIGRYNVRTQEGPDCVSFATAGAVDNLKATEIIIGGQLEEWVAETSTEDIYGGSRIQVGQGDLGNSGGSYGGWAARYIKEYGTLVRQKYDGIDLSKYNVSKANLWGSPGQGTPSILLPFAKEHTVKTVSLILSYQECVDSLYNGYPVIICSNQGFSSTRDREGFCSPNGTWAHAMLIIGMDDEYKRPGVLIQNSWGPNWVSGPKRHEQPDGSFWCDASVLERNILSKQDSWAISDYIGFAPKKLNTRLF